MMLRQHVNIIIIIIVVMNDHGDEISSAGAPITIRPWVMQCQCGCTE